MGSLGLRYNIQSPSGTHYNFRVKAYRVNEDGSRSYEPFVSPDLEAINRRLRGGQMKESDAHLAIRNLVAMRYRLSEDLQIKLRHTQLAEKHTELLSNLWENKYGSRFLVDPRTTEYEFVRALKALGSLSIYTATGKEIQDALKANTKDVNQHRRVVGKLNELLRFIGRDITLGRPSKPRKAIKHLKHDDILLLASHASNPRHKMSVIGLYGGGFRIGEWFGLEEDSLRGENQVYVDRQQKKDGSITLPKRGKVGLVSVFPQSWEMIKEWAALEKNRYQEYPELYSFIKKASIELWPKNKSKHITIHDLRHSHAVRLREHYAAIIDDVAMNLRNDVKVCQDYYAGYGHTETTANRLKALLQEKSP